jgi:hypothetical protein
MYRIIALSSLALLRSQAANTRVSAALKVHDELCVVTGNLCLY